MKQNIEPIIVKKNVKHIFSAEERVTFSNDLVTALDAKTNAEAEFDSVKQSYKAKITEAESRVGSLASALRAGFDMRVKDCLCIFRPEVGKKDIFVKDDYDWAVGERHTPIPFLTEEMTQDDYQQDLIRAEAKFEKRKEFTLWEDTTQAGILIVGQFNGRWHSALRLNLKNKELQERLDSEQMSFKNRIDAIRRAGKRALDWLKSEFGDEDELGAEVYKMFRPKIEEIIEAEKDKVE